MNTILKLGVAGAHRSRACCVLVVGGVEVDQRREDFDRGSRSVPKADLDRGSRSGPKADLERAKGECVRHYARVLLPL